MMRSDFFQSHEVIGSSLLFVHDRNQASVWLIDFAKTVNLPSDTSITHNSKWSVGNHEDGYLIGINNLINIFEELMNNEARNNELDMQSPSNDLSQRIMESNQSFVDTDTNTTASSTHKTSTNIEQNSAFTDTTITQNEKPVELTSIDSDIKT